MSFGILNQIEMVVKKFGANVEARMHNKLSTMHCAAQSYSGYLSILVLVQKYKLSPNIRDNFNATPLHFAIINKEFKNVELLIKCGADVNA
jgi:ankyrin repeat protein